MNHLLIKKIKKNVLIFLLVLLGVIIPALFITLIPNNGISKDISGVFSVIRSLSSLATLVLALFLFNKFGIEKDILGKKFDAISHVFDILAKTRFLIKTDDGSTHFIFLLRDLRAGRFSEFNTYKDKIVAGNVTVMEGIEELSSLGESIFMPKEVAVCIQKISVRSLHCKEDIEKNPKKYAFVQFCDVKKTIFSVECGKEVEDTTNGLLNNKELNLAEYLQTFDDLYRACQKWLKANSSINLDLNS